MCTGKAPNSFSVSYWQVLVTFPSPQIESYQISILLMANTTTLNENSPMDITHSAPSPGSVEVVSGDESSTTMDVGDFKVDDLNESQLLGDDEVYEDLT